MAYEKEITFKNLLKDEAEKIAESLKKRPNRVVTCIWLDGDEILDTKVYRNCPDKETRESLIVDMAIADETTIKEIFPGTIEDF